MVKKGQKKRVWTPEQKSEIVHKHLGGRGVQSREYFQDVFCEPYLHTLGFLRLLGGQGGDM